MKSILKRAWAEISLDNVRENFREIRKHLDEKSERKIKIMAMVKADAYGHGAPMIAKALAEEGADFFGVSSIDEAMQLRMSGISNNILMMGYIPSEFVPQAIENDISMTVYNLFNAKKISDIAVKIGKIAKIHIKLDTGMYRLGFLTEHEDERIASIEDIIKISKLPSIEIEGSYTHFSDADGDTEEYTRLQYGRFITVTEEMKKHGINPGIRHCLNSAGILRFPEYALDMARPGIILYGLSPLPKKSTPIKLKPIMTLKAAVSQIKNVKNGAEISYGRSEKAVSDRCLAVLPIGYADGLLRKLSGSYSVSVGGINAKIVGRICMDQTIVDITGIPDVYEGDEAVIFGDGTDGAQTVEKLAKAAGTIHYEMCCLIGKRVPRLYFSNDKLVGKLNYILK